MDLSPGKSSSSGDERNTEVRSERGIGRGNGVRLRTSRNAKRVFWQVLTLVDHGHAGQALAFLAIILGTTVSLWQVKRADDNAKQASETLRRRMKKA